MIARVVGVSIMMTVLCGIVPPAERARAETQDTARFSVLAAVEMALAKYPAVAVAANTAAQAKASAREATAAWFPTLSAVASATRYEEPMAAFPIHGFKTGLLPPFNEKLGQYGLSLTYTLFDGWARDGEIRRTRAQFDAAEAALDQTRQGIAARVISAYLNVLSKREVLAAHDHRVSAMEAELNRVNQYFRQAKAAHVEVLRAEAALANAQAEQTHAKAALEVARRDLASLLGIEVDEALVARLVPVRLGESSMEEREPLISRALAASPTVAQARCAATAAHAGVTVAQSVRWPKVQLAGNYLDQGDFDGHRTAEWNAGVTLTYPFFTGGMLTRRIDRARSAERSAEDQIKLAELQTAQDIDRAIAAIQEARSRVVSLTKAVESLTEVARIEKLLVDAGSSTQTDYLDAEASLLTARANLAEAQQGAITARVELARLAGELNNEWMSRNLENQP